MMHSYCAPRTALRFVAVWFALVLAGGLCLPCAQVAFGEELANSANKPAAAEGVEASEGLASGASGLSVPEGGLAPTEGVETGKSANGAMGVVGGAAVGETIGGEAGELAVSADEAAGKHAAAVGDKTFKTLDEAFEYAIGLDESATVKLIGDTYLSADVVIPAGSSLTLDLTARAFSTPMYLAKATERIRAWWCWVIWQSSTRGAVIAKSVSARR